VRTAEAAPGPSLGLYSGSTGVGLAAAAVGVLLSEPSLPERALALLRRIRQTPREINGFDLLSGRAGAVSALLALHELLGETALLDFAGELGDELVATAERSDLGWSWRGSHLLRHRNLTGLSHGTAGVAHALTGLFAATGQSTYREGAEGAFAYERSCFDRERANWPDFRDEPSRSRRGRRPFAFRLQWCHGAPGIALSRLDALETLGGSCYREEALTALTTTVRETVAARERGSLSFCLCHGLAGNADILIDGRSLLAAAGLEGVRLPEVIGEAGLTSYGSTGRPWPCGIPVPSRETPGLMLGLAGIGHFYLRLQYPETVPSLLLLRPAQLAKRLDALASGSTSVRAHPIHHSPYEEGI
jgi:lantibiotic modifying enzyme